ncbi:MAG: hypothetical protein MMC33_007592 [Icmadophila ericetorum]|nr:hypothetical protein [Icmadophila ericetorum]
MQAWCLHDRGFEDGVLVSENKLILWMEEVILPRVVKKRTKTKPSAAASKSKRRRIVDRPTAMLVEEEGAVEGEVVAKTAGVEEEGSSASEAEVGIKAETVTEGHNTYPNPRGSAFKGKMKAIRKRPAAKRRVDYEDRHTNSIIDGVNIEQLERFTVATLCNPP